MDKAKKETAILSAILEGYSTGNFDNLFAFMTDDYQHASFWVVEVIKGKENTAIQETHNNVKYNKNDAFASKPVVAYKVDVPTT